MTPLHFQRFVLNLILLSSATWISCNGANVQDNLFRSPEDKKTVIVNFYNDDYDKLLYAVSKKYEQHKKEYRTEMLYHALDNYTKSCQGAAHDYLSSNGYKYKSMWASNTLIVDEADLNCVNTLGKSDQVESITENRIIVFNKPDEFTEVSETPASQNTPATGFGFGTTWGMSRIYAREAWKVGSYYGSKKTGKGIVVGSIDSGVRRNHEQLRGSYRSYLGWADGFHESPEIFDGDGHGTFTMGIMVGSDIGVAPGAQWITCRGCKNIGCYESALLFCGEWMLCPFNTSTSTKPYSYKDCYSPDIINNSWGGNPKHTFYERMVKAWRAVGIIPVFAAGNDGPKCGTINSPATFPNVIAVGATDSDSRLASFSSRGPTNTTDPYTNEKMKPEITAPGVAVTSSYYLSDHSYVSGSGTSASAPFVSGVIALILERCRIPYKTVLAILEYTAEQEGLGKTTQICGGTNSSSFPNNFYGYGLLNALKAVEKVLEVCHLNYSPSYYAHPSSVNYPQMRAPTNSYYSYPSSYRAPAYTVG